MVLQQVKIGGESTISDLHAENANFESSIEILGVLFDIYPTVVCFFGPQKKYTLRHVTYNRVSSISNPHNPQIKNYLSHFLPKTNSNEKYALLKQSFSAQEQKWEILRDESVEATYRLGISDWTQKGTLWRLFHFSHVTQIFPFSNLQLSAENQGDYKFQFCRINVFPCEACSLSHQIAFFFFQFSAALRLLLFLVDLLMLTFLGLRSRNDKFKLFFFTRSHTPLPSAILAVGPETRVLQKRNFLRTKKNILSSIDIHSVNSFLALNTEKSWQV